MSTSTSTRSRTRTVGLIGTVAAMGLVSVAFAQRASTTDREFIEMQTSINAIMVAVVDWAAHEVWEAGYAETLTGRNWLTVKQYATQLLASGTLVSLGGTGPADSTWVNNQEWQRWSARLIRDTQEILLAIEAQDQEMLQASGDKLLNTCDGCHEIFKPSSPTEGIMHVPHHEYENPVIDPERITGGQGNL